MSFTSSLGEWRQDQQHLAQSFAAAVRQAVLDGRLSIGSPLPSERVLAGELRLSRGTVVNALGLLRDDGWIHTRHGSGSVVRLPPHVTSRTAPWSLDHADGEVDLDLTQAVTSAPHEAYLAALQRAVDRSPRLLVESGVATAGLPRLRELLAERYTREGLPTDPGQILVTSGAMSAFTLVTEHFHERLRPVAVENPTYPGALAILRRRRARLAPIPVTANGWADVEHVIRTSGAGLAYLIPDFQNPTGALMPDERRVEVAESANRHNVTVITDETVRDLDLRTPATPIPHLSGPRVVSIGSTSKLIWSGLRVGWIRASAGDIRHMCLNPLQAQLSPPPLEQVIAAELLADVDEVLQDRRTRLRAQRDHLVGLLSARTDWTCTVPAGGLTLWLRLHGTTGAAVAADALRKGLAVTPGPLFSPDRTLTNYVRLPFTATPEVLTKAVGLLT